MADRQPRLRGLARGVGATVVAAVVDAAIAGAAIGAVDLALVMRRGGPPPAGWLALAGVVVGLAVSLSATLGAVLVLALRVTGRHTVFASLLAGMRQPGPPRVEALARCVGGLIALGGVWAAGAVILFGARDPGYGHPLLQTLLAATRLTFAIALIALLACAAGPLVRRAGRSRLLDWLTRWPRGAVIAAGVGLTGAVGAHFAAMRAVPALDPFPAYVILLHVAGLLAVAGCGPARRLRPRALAAAAALAALVALGAPALVVSAPRAHRLAAEHAAVGAVALTGLRWLADGDGDGYPGGLGGLDCDDDDSAVHPGAREKAANGIDDNCTAGDAPGNAPRRPMAPRWDLRAVSRPPAGAPDVILITIDTVRADHVSSYGYGRPTTPSLDALAARGTRFEHAHSPWPATHSALPSLLLSAQPLTLPYRSIGRKALSAHGLPSLGTVFAAGGWETAWILRDALGGLGKLEGGFHTVDSNATRPATATERAPTDAALRWLDGVPRETPVFLWLHYFDPHEPYQPPPSVPRFGDDVVARYDGELRSVDDQLAALLAGLERRNRLESAIIAVTSDHGEAFGDHGTRFHDQNLYDDQTRVPLVIVVPGAVPRVIHQPVSLVDVAPTLLELAGLAPAPTMRGTSLARAVRDGAPPGHPVLTEMRQRGLVAGHLVALHHGRHVLIRDLVGGTEELYDVEADPGQLLPLEESELTPELRWRLDEALELRALDLTD